MCCCLFAVCERSCVECCIGIGCALTFLFWCCSIFILLLRATSRSFQALTCYGGRSNAACHQSDHNSCLSRRRMHRKNAFIAFYCSGVFTCGAIRIWSCSYAPLTFGRNALSDVICEASGGGRFFLMPLTLFCLHCLLRLAECLFVHQFRSEGDTVTIFAAVSGSVFYVFASASVYFDSVNAMMQKNLLGSKTSIIFDERLAALFLMYVSLRGAQVWVHYVLASLRGRSSSHPGKEARSTVDYSFPLGRGLFRIVLEPHYMLEVIMYLLLVAASVILSNVGPHEPLASLEMNEDGSQFTMPTSILRPGVLTGLVAFFSLINLGMTSAEHRAFWLSRKKSVAEKLPYWNILPGLY